MKKRNVRIGLYGAIAPVLLSAFAVLMLSTSCGKKKSVPQAISYPLETAKLVSQATSGVVSANDWIRVRFVEPVADQRQVSTDPERPKWLPNKLFRFDPRIKGKAFWEDERTLAFKPSKPMTVRTTYRCRVDLQRLFPANKKSPLKPLELRFIVTAREVFSFEGDLVPVSENNPALFIYQGTIEFTENVPVNDLREAARLSVDSKKWGLTFEQDASGRKFKFKSAAIQRDKRDKNFQFKIDKGKLALGADFTKDAFLPPLMVMEVTEALVQVGEREASLVLTFSDELDLRRDPVGRITVEPAVDFKASILAKEIRLSGKFDFGKTYTLRVKKGVRSRWGTLTAEDFVRAVRIEDIKPQIRFSSNGVFLSTSNEQKIRFETVNVRRVRLNVKQVFDSNLGQFLQTEKLEGRKSRNEGFREWELERVGVDVVNDSLELSDRKNAWLQHELDIKKLLQKNPRGLFLVSLDFSKRDILYGEVKSPGAGEGGEDSEYWSYDINDPASYAYYNQFGRVFKPVLFSDIGLTCKAAGKRFLVFATDIRSARPMPGATVTLRTYQNQNAGRAETDGRGVAEFTSVASDVFYVEAENNGQKSVVKLGDMAWNLSGFDTGGESTPPDGLRAFLYTERGVYRPGDEINLCLIARNPDGTFPDRHPVTLKVFNPKNQMVFEETRKDGTDGFTHFRFSTRPEDPTGTWSGQIQIGSRRFGIPLKIETIVPYTLKVEVKPARERLGPEDRSLSVELSAKTLFGAPAGGYPVSVNVSLRPSPKRFPAFDGFIFSNASVEFTPRTETVYSGSLDVQGNARVDWTLPPLSGSPSSLTAEVAARVIEKGGRPNLNDLAIPIDPFQNYVGVKPPAEGEDYIQVGATLDIPIVLVRTDGAPVKGRELVYRVYRNRQWWWWEYENQSQYKLRFKSDKETEMIKQGKVLSDDKPTRLQVVPPEWGQYFVEIQDGQEGHIAGFFFSAYNWGEVPSGGEGADLLVLKADRKQYRPGDKAEITFPSPGKCAILVTVEKGGRILLYEWADPGKSGDKTSVLLPVTDEMMPNAYVTVSLIQPHDQTLNDRPIRMYGVLPLLVVDPSTRQEIRLVTPASFEPNKSCLVEIRTADEKPTQFTLAVVDEGLLDLTRFATPDPWKAFYSKERLQVNSYDLFSQIIGANKGDVFRTFSIGGDQEEAYRQSQLGAEKVKRFKPVVVFRGPLMTDKRGRAKVVFDMPNYVGSVRVMAIAASGRTYGMAEKAVPVKTELIVQPGLPRVFGPNDKIIMPVTVFAMEKGVGKVDVTVETEGPVFIVGDAKKRVEFAETGEQDMRFELASKPAVGKAVIKLRAASLRRTVESTTEIAVRASSPRIFESQEKVLERGGSVSMVVPARGLEGTNEAKVTVWRRPQMNLDRRLRWLIHYPYGCIEQTVSSVFPQLYLKTILKTSESEERTIDANIRAGIQRLQNFQLASGAFSYWPGCRDVSGWGTDYAGHFLVEAKKLGYPVPEALFRNWLEYEKNQVHLPKDGVFIQAHRLFLLSLSGVPQISAMNVLKEDSLGIANDAAKWLLAGAYQLAGAGKTAQEILQKAGTKTSGKPCWYWWHTYGSDLRDRAVILEAAVLFERWTEANLIVDEFTRLLSAQEWYSTQTTGYMLLGLGKYLKGNETGKLPVISGTVRMPDGTKVNFDTDAFNAAFDVKGGFGKSVEIQLDGKSTVNRVFCQVSWSGIPLEPDMAQVEKNLSLSVEWLDQDGKPVDPSRLRQGISFWGHFRASPASPHFQHIDEVALVQVLPSGWEIENTRLSGEDMPAWTSPYALNRFDYMDVRDDRIMWFFDFEPYGKRTLDFLVKLNAVTTGEFVLPPLLCEAMYDANYQARKGGGKVVVE
jgi:uncharacterized protein YfaS (alpha-2-macroglobulin family)